MKQRVDYDNETAVGTHEGAASTDTPTRLSEDFDFDKIDSLRDHIRQRIADGEHIGDIVQSLARKQADQLIADRLAVFVALIRSAKKPILFLDCLWMLSGAALREGATIQSLARRHSCSKQAFQQAMERVAERFPFPKTRTERDEDARAAMRAAYFPKPKI